MAHGPLFAPHVQLATAHLANSERPLLTACGLRWEDWQEPDMPSNEEIGFDELSYGIRVAIRQSDEARQLKPGDQVSQCQACLKLAMAG